MRHMVKYIPAIIMGATLGGCSMAGSGDYFADEYAPMQHMQMPYYYGEPVANAPSPCQPIVITPQVNGPCQPHYLDPNADLYAARPSQHHGQTYGHPVQGPYIQPTYGQDLYGQNIYGQNPYGYNAYGNGAYVPPTYSVQPYGLRGPSKAFKPHAYANLGAVSYEAGEDLYGAQGRLGYQFNKYLGAEAEGSLGVSKDKRDGVFSGVPIEQTLEIKNSVAGFGVLRYPLTGKLSGYGRVGYHQTKLDRSLSDATGTLSDTSFTVDGIAYGSGLEYAVSPRTAVRLDYTNYDYDGPDADAISLAISRKF